jgi:hypothetical protein
LLEHVKLMEVPACAGMTVLVLGVARALGGSRMTVLVLGMARALGGS